MKSYTLDNLHLGDKVEVGRFRNVMTTVRAIEIDEHGQQGYNYKQRSQKLLSPRLMKLIYCEIKTNTFREK